MSQMIGDRIPEAVLPRLAVERAWQEADCAIVICSVDDQGRPHPAMLSSLDVIATDAQTVRLVTYASSRTARNLRQNGHLTIVLADERGVYYIKGAASILTASMEAAPHLAAFSVRVSEILEDSPAAHEHARVTSGIRVLRDHVDRSHADAILTELLRLEPRQVSLRSVPETKD